MRKMMNVKHWIFVSGLWGIFFLGMSLYADEINKTTPVSEQQPATEEAKSGKTTATPEDPELTKLKQENALLSEQETRDLWDMTTQKNRLVLENELLAAKTTQLLAQIEAERQKIAAENALQEELNKRGELKLIAETATLEAIRNKLAVENALQAERNKGEELKITLETAKIEFAKLQQSLRLEELNSKIAQRVAQQEWDNEVNKEPEYLTEPYLDGKLIISDRKITINYYIFSDTADYVEERIHYFNNKDPHHPIFLVIDYCYGGSVIAGARIIKTMQNSQAPVYVVVKSLANSMAAVIAASAKRSFAYPDALIGHHEISLFFFFGNTSYLREKTKYLEEWSKRLLQPVAEKMGVTLEEFIHQMYLHSTTGFWQEFATEAQKLQWVDFVVPTIRDTSYTRNPDKKTDKETDEDFDMKAVQATDEKGNAYVQLPPVIQGDFYYLYNPDNHYRW